VFDKCHQFKQEIENILKKIDESNAVVDDASHNLKITRDNLRKQRNRLNGTLNSYLMGNNTARYLQERVVTERGGRFVLIVKTEHRGAIPGIVHGSSGSGASLFLEPLSTVDINNDIVALEENETAEIQLILLQLANTLRKRAIDLRHTLNAACDIDVIQARATFSRLVKGVEPELVSNMHIELVQARHPLLIPAVRRRLNVEAAEADLAEPVPFDLHVTPPTSALVITGPNTGGKTVALKTTGLLALMAQSGLHVPAAPGSCLPVFRTVFTDIGDEQSIEASLSTFSGHIRNIVSMDKHLTLPALLLLDEVGAGTDPVEGGALGAAIIDYFRNRGAIIVATTHDETLKSYAETTNSVLCAGFGFDQDTFAPNYRLTYGLPGRSLALEIGERLGLAPLIIESARNHRSSREAKLANHLTKIDSDMRKLDAERKELEEGQKKLKSDRLQLDTSLQELHSKQEILREKISKNLASDRRAARVAIDTIIEQLRVRSLELEQAAAKRSATGQTTLTTGETGSLGADAKTALDKVVDRVWKSHEKDLPFLTPTTPPTEVGSQVAVISLEVEGTLLAINDGQADVEIRGKKLRVTVDDLKTIEGKSKKSLTTGGNITAYIENADDPLEELNVIGCTVEEALSLTEKYLDQALIREQLSLRVIHGYGKGKLCRAIASLLENHQQVAQFSPATPEHGGNGVTVIELRN
jgi:DNA mismatch repair protein MutS2